MSDRVFVLAPTQLDLWDQCRRCFYLAAAAKFPRPTPAAGASALISQRLLSGLQGARADKVADGMPSGLVDVGRHALSSAPLPVQVPDGVFRCVIRGDLHLVIRLEGAACALAELTIGVPDAATLGALTRRLVAWAQAVEKPERGSAQSVPALGVLAFEPDQGGPTGVTGAWRWMPVVRDDAELYGFLAEALSALAQPRPPGGTALCPWCVYRDAGRRTGF